MLEHWFRKWRKGQGSKEFGQLLEVGKVESRFVTLHSFQLEKKDQ